MALAGLEAAAELGECLESLLCSQGCLLGDKGDVSLCNPLGYIAIYNIANDY